MTYKYHLIISSESKAQKNEIGHQILGHFNSNIDLNQRIVTPIMVLAKIVLTKFIPMRVGFISELQ